MASTIESTGTLNVGGVVSVEFVELLCGCANTFDGLLNIDKPKELINTDIIKNAVNLNNRKLKNIVYKNLGMPYHIQFNHKDLGINVNSIHNNLSSL